jgi:hypothetical protein
MPADGRRTFLEALGLNTAVFKVFETSSLRLLWLREKGILGFRNRSRSRKEVTQSGRAMPADGRCSFLEPLGLNAAVFKVLEATLVKIVETALLRLGCEGTLEFRGHLQCIDGVAYSLAAMLADTSHEVLDRSILKGALVGGSINRRCKPSLREAEGHDGGKRKLLKADHFEDVAWVNSEK